MAYYFLTPELFEERVRAGAFLEHAIVHGNRYGTLKETIRSAMLSGKSVMLDIDVQGAQQVRETLSELPADDAMVLGFVDVFIRPPSMAVLEERLVGRGEDALQVIEQRLANAEREMACMDEYRYCIVNDDLNVAVKELRDILDKEGSL